MRMDDWVPVLALDGRPRYIAIAEAIAADIKSGRLGHDDRLPPQRKLARKLGVDFTTVARGYVEAQRRGLLESRVGQGTYVRNRREETPNRSNGLAGPVDFSMNLPPEPDDPQLLERMRVGVMEVAANLTDVLRYQAFGGSVSDKDAATNWLGRRALVPAHDRLFITPGAHGALLAIFSTLAKAGDTILSENLTYPGARALAAQLGLNLVGLTMDEEGVDPDALTEACIRLAPKALYLNPTLQNPTTLTVSASRRMEIAAVARRFRLPIVEDDAYGFLPVQAPRPFAALAPELTWHISGLAKCLGAGLRIAYVITPDARAAWPFVAVARAANVMASPLTAALATRWIEDGTADAVLGFVRAEAQARQKLVAEILPPETYRADPCGFHTWLYLPPQWSCSAFVGHTRATGIGIISSHPFNTDGRPPEAVRVCLGGPSQRATVRGALEFIAHSLEEQPALASGFL
jgi:DNA-binding transcriptional MocR family regulator